MLAGLRLSIRSPYLLFGGQDKSCTNRIKYSILTFCTFPILPVLLKCKLHIIKLKRNSKRAGKELDKQRSWLQFQIRKLIKLELGLETLYQLALQIILLLNFHSNTRTFDVLNQVFKNGIDLLSKIALSLSIIWSFASSILSNLSGLSAKR